MAERRRRRPRTRGGVIGELLLLVVVVVLATTMVRTFLVAPFSIPSGSMEQTLHVGDRILVDRLSYRFHDVRRESDDSPGGRSRTSEGGSS